MKKKDLYSKSEKELQDLLKKERSEIVSLHFQSAKGRSKNVKAAKNHRRMVARILTRIKKTS